MCTEVAHCPRPEERITNYVQQHIGVRVAHSTKRTGNENAPEPKLVALGQSVYIVTRSNP